MYNIIHRIIYTERTILLKNLKFLYRFENNFVLDHQNNFGILKIMSNAGKNFGILATSLSVPHNYFDV